MNVSSFSISASRIGAGNPQIRSSRFSVIVLRRALMKVRSLKALMNHSKPWFLAQGSSHGALNMLFSLNAPRIHAIGT